MKNRWIGYVVPFIFILLAIFSFRTYVFQHKVPLPFNLLVFYYSPWKHETEYGLTIPNKPLGYDNLKLFYPLRKFTVEQLKKGKIPLWNPYVFSGNVHLATYQTAVFYPLNFFYFLFPMTDAWSLLVIAQPVLAGWFTFLFITSLGVSKRASLFGAIGFAFSGWMIAMWEEVLVLEHSFLWMPLALYGSNLLWDSLLKRRGIVLLIIALTMSILAGFLQMSIYVFLVVLLWNIYRWFTYKDVIHRNKIIFHVFISVILSGFLSSIQWVPALEAYSLSARGTIDAANLFQMFLSPLSHLITFIVPDFWGNPGSYNYFSTIRYIQERTIYVGMYVVIFAILVLLKHTRGDQRFWKFFTFVTLSLGFALPTSWFWYIFRIPILSVAQPARIFALSTFGICVVASFGIDEWEKHRPWKALKRILIFIFLFLFLLFIFTLSMRLISGQPQLLSLCNCDPKQVIAYATISLRNLLLPSASAVIVLISFIFFQKRLIFYGFIYTVTIFSGLYYANKMLYFSERQYEFPSAAPIVKLKELSGFNRVWSYEDAYVMRNILSYFGLYSPEGYDALFSKHYGEFINTIKSGGIATDHINRTDVDFSEVGPDEPMTKNPQRLRIMSILGVKYILALKPKAVSKTTEQEQFPSSLFSLVWSNDIWRIWEYHQALPRAYFTSNYIVAGKNQEIIDNLLNPSFPLQDTLIFESKSREFESISIEGGSGEVSITKYEPQVIDLAVHAKQNGYLFLSDTYYPGWKAFVDNKETKIYRADYAFRAVPVPSGNHSVRFIYDPISFKIAVITSVIASVLALLFIVKISRESRRG